MTRPPDAIETHRPTDTQPPSGRRGRPKGSRSVHFRQSLAIAYAVCGGLTRNQVFEALGRVPTEANHNWLRRRLNYGSEAMNDPTNRDWLEEVYDAKLRELDPDERKAFHLARLRALAAVV
jgi:hypothetical protein